MNEMVEKIFFFLICFGLRALPSILLYYDHDKQ